MIDGEEYCGVDFDGHQRGRGGGGRWPRALEGCPETWGTALYEAFDQKVEGSSIQPTFITMHPWRCPR
ncbi:MAG: hypothetical protein ACLUFL_07950 [Flavonifractor plautii]